jgi:pantothenate kinase type III
MLLLFDIGNTHTHLGLADSKRVRRRADILTAGWFDGRARRAVTKFVGNRALEGAAFCSVVPKATPMARQTAELLLAKLNPNHPGRHGGRRRSSLRVSEHLSHSRVRAKSKPVEMECLELTPQTLCGVGIDYPKPETIGPDRLANAVAAQHAYGAPVVVVDFGTAVTFDVVDKKGNYVGGIIAPGLAAMTEYLHEKTALLPRIRIREVKTVIGKNTEEAMLVGAVHGYRGLVHELIQELQRALNCRRLPVVATGGYAKLIAAKVPEITGVDPLLTLEGLRLVWHRRTCQPIGEP